MSSDDFNVRPFASSAPHVHHRHDLGYYLTSFKDELLSTWLISTTPPQPRAAACVISKIYDQTEYRNDLGIGPAGGNGRKDMPVDAAKEPVSIGGHSVYGAYFEGGMGYRNDTTTKVATDNEPESIYMVASGTHYNGGCCFDYGNAEINNRDDGAGTMECVYFGSWNAKRNGGWCGGDGDGTPNAGPWVMADLENGEETKKTGFFGGLRARLIHPPQCARTHTRV
jgi:hypothetical protein